MLRKLFGIDIAEAGWLRAILKMEHEAFLIATRRAVSVRSIATLRDEEQHVTSDIN